MLLKIDKSDTKVIHGYNCYKIQVIENSRAFEVEEGSSIFINLGKIIYDMYVTDKIKLYPFVVIPFFSEVKDFLPLEGLISIEKFPVTNWKFSVIKITK